MLSVFKSFRSSGWLYEEIRINVWTASTSELPSKVFKVAQVWRTGSFKWHPLLLAFLYQKRYTPYMGPINIRCEKYINDSYITKQSDHYVKRGQIGLKRSASWSLIPIQSPRGSRGRPLRSGEVNGWARRVRWGQGIGLQGPRGSRGRPIGFQGSTGSEGVEG